MPRSNASSLPDTTALCSAADHEPERIPAAVAIHQPNLFPRLSTLAKLYAADCVVVLDDVQFARRDYQHRTRLAALDNAERWQWLSLDTHLPNGQATLIRDARIVEPIRSRRRLAELVRQYYRPSVHWPVIDGILAAVLDQFDRTDRTAHVTEASTRALLDALGWRGEILRSSDVPSGSGRSERLADLATMVGAGTYLCGTGGMDYLETGHFTARGITVTPVLPLPAELDPIWLAARKVSALRGIASVGPAQMAEKLASYSYTLAPLSVPSQRASS